MSQQSSNAATGAPTAAEYEGWACAAAYHLCDCGAIRREPTPLHPDDHTDWCRWHLTARGLA